MMRMKRLLAAFVAIVMLMVPSLVFADKADDLNALGILPAGIDYNAEEVTYATRGEFAYIVARVLNSGEIAAANTNFSDVKSDNVYSGYIQHLADRGIVNGTTGAMFSPEDVIDANAASKMLVCALGLKKIAEETGGYPSGYNNLAKRLGLYKGITAIGGNLRRDDAAVMVHNALLAEVPEEYINSRSRLLCDIFGLSAYSGVMTDTNVTDNTATFRVDENLYEQNPEILDAGDEFTIKASKLLNITEYERVPVTVWVNKQAEIVNIFDEVDAQVVFGYILSINGDDSVEGAYDTSEIEKLMFINNEEEYTVSDKLLIKHNNKYTTSTVKLCGKFAKAVVVNDEIIFIESFNLSEGGIVTGFTDRNITYTKGTVTNYTIRDYDLKESIKAYVNNKPADIKDVRVGCVFDFYETETELVIVTAEKVLYDTFDMYNEGESVTIGNVICSIKGSVYTSEDGGASFVENTKIKSLLGKKVKAYIAPDGYVKYLIADKSGETTSEFYGVVAGVKNNDTGFSKEVDVKLFKIGESTAEEVICPLSEKASVEGIEGVSNYDQLITYLSTYAGDIESGKNVLIFKINSKGEISKVSAPIYFEGTDENGSGTTPLIGDYPEISWTGSPIGNTIGYTRGRIFFHIQKLDGKFTVLPVASNQIARSGTKCCFRFYGEGKIAEPEHILVFGDANDHTASGNYRYGLYTGETTTVINEDGEILNRIHIINYGEEKFYDVPDEYLAEINAETGGAAYICYMETVSGAKNPIVLKDVSKILFLSESSDEWLYDERNQAISGFTLKKGTVEKVAGSRIYFKDGSAYYELNENKWKTAATVYDMSRGDRFEKAALSDLEPGDVVYYDIDNSKGRIWCWIKVGD